MIPFAGPKPVGPKDEVGGLGRVLDFGGEKLSRSRDLFLWCIYCTEIILVKLLERLLDGFCCMVVRNLNYENGVFGDCSVVAARVS